ncbi:uncharacterized protein LOC119794916 isoform X2 [Cyprinodon tularosa]|nr:uncharacterized protein LOC119794916 isoform X2 [Cyprinodon tularosa]
MGTNQNRWVQPEPLGPTRTAGSHQNPWVPPEPMGPTRTNGSHQNRWVQPEPLGPTRTAGSHQNRWVPPEPLGPTRTNGSHQNQWVPPEPLGPTRTAGSNQHRLVQPEPEDYLEINKTGMKGTRRSDGNSTRPTGSSRVSSSPNWSDWLVQILDAPAINRWRLDLSSTGSSGPSESRTIQLWSVAALHLYLTAAHGHSGRFWSWS